MIPEARSSDFQQEYGPRIRRQVVLSSGQFSPETGKTVRWLRTSYSCFHFPEPIPTLRPGTSLDFKHELQVFAHIQGRGGCPDRTTIDPPLSTNTF
jgi:hypothetical protein